MKIELEVSEKHETTAEPWWLIIDPRQMMRPDCHTVAGMIDGPFFSREEAEMVLKSRAHHYSKNAVVFCHSGCYTNQYKNAYQKAEQMERDGVR